MTRTIFALLVLVTIASPAQDLHLRRTSFDDKGNAVVAISRFSPQQSSLVAIDTADIVVEIDGLQVRPRSITCKDNGGTDRISSVLTIDVSGSMARGAPNITLARAAAHSWIRALSPESECAITAFDHSVSLVTDFTSDTAALLAGVSRLLPRGGTDYDAGLLTDEIGGIPLAATGKHKRILVFLTDGVGRANEERMIAEATAAGVTVYAVTLGVSMPASIQRLCEASGGLWFDNVTTVEQATMAYKRIYTAAISPQQCDVVLEFPPGCSQERNIVIRVGKDVVRRVFTLPPGSRWLPSASPLSLRYDVGSERQTFTVRAGNAPLTITDLQSIGIAKPVVTISGTPPVFPIVIPKHDSITFSVLNTVVDSVYTVSRLQFTSTPCPLPDIYLSSGSVAQKPRERTIRVDYPNGGESIPAYSKTTLRYSGVPPELPVRIEVSTDLGGSWTVVNGSATGNSTKWDVPPVSSDSCLMRVSQVIPDAIRHQPVYTILSIRVEQWGYLNDGARVASAGLVRRVPNGEVDSTVRIFDAKTAVLLHTFRGVRYAELGNTSTLVTWGVRGELEGYDVRTGEKLWNVSAMPTNKLLSVLPDTSGRTLFVLGGWGNRPHILDGTNGLTISRLPVGSFDPQSASISADGSKVAVCKNGDSLFVFNARTAEQLFATTIPQVSKFYRTAFSPDGRKLVATASNGTAVVWSTEDGKLLRTIARRQFVNDNNYVVFLPDGKHVVLETGADQSSIVNIESGENNVTMQRTPGIGGVVNATVSRDGSRIALSSLGRITIHEAATGVMIYEMRQVEYTPTFSPDGQRVTLRTEEGAAGVYDIVPAIFQADTSDARWRIYKINAHLKDIRFETTAVGLSRDTLIRGALRNNGGDTLFVDDIRIDGAEAKNFDVRTQPGFYVPPGDSVAIEYGFMPRKVGERAALIVVDASGARLRARISGPARGTILTAEADLLNCGTVDVGVEREFSIDKLIYNSSKSPIRVRSVRIVEDADRAFTLMSSSSFVIPPESGNEIVLRFIAQREGRMTARMMFEVDGINEPLYAVLYGRGLVDTFRIAKSDPTTFRGILLPTSIVPPKGTIVTGIYDVVGLTAGYSVTNNIMVLAGGVPPLSNQWFGNSDVTPAWTSAWSAGVKAGFPLDSLITVGGGYQLGSSYYDQPSTSEIDSRISFNALWASLGYGSDDHRLNVHVGYAFKYHHRPYEGSFQADATIFGIGYDYRVAYSWKVCAEAFFMRSMTFVPITFTARYFDQEQAFDIGFAVTGIPASGEPASNIPIVPMLSWVRRW